MKATKQAMHQVLCLRRFLQQPAIVQDYMETERLNGSLCGCASSCKDLSESSLLTKRAICPCNSCVVSSHPTPASCNTTEDVNLSCDCLLLSGTGISILVFLDSCCASSSTMTGCADFGAGRSHFCSITTKLLSTCPVVCIELRPLAVVGG